MAKLLLTATTLLATAIALNDGVGRLPAMGYDTFNAFGCSYNSSSVLAQAEAMERHGLVDAGYNILILDDCYALKERNSSGYMVADLTKFPHGLPAFSKKVNSLGIKLAAYGDNGYETCAGYPGSYGHELQDLEVLEQKIRRELAYADMFFSQTWHSWGMSYLKYDNCCECRIEHALIKHFLAISKIYPPTTLPSKTCSAVTLACPRP